MKGPLPARRLPGGTIIGFPWSGDIGRATARASPLSLYDTSREPGTAGVGRRGRGDDACRSHLRPRSPYLQPRPERPDAPGGMTGVPSSGRPGLAGFRDVAGQQLRRQPRLPPEQLHDRRRNRRVGAGVPGDCGHRKGSWITVPGARASETTSSAARSTARWPAGSPGRPSGRANGNSIPATRGAPTEAVNSGIIDSNTVAMPLASMTFWTSPTDRQQIGQTGTSRATSTASPVIRAAIAGAVEASSCRGSRM